MTHHDYERAVVSILKWLHLAEDDLVGSVVQTFNGEAGTVKGLQLDEAHGLCFTLDDPYVSDDKLVRDMRRWYPVSTIRLKS